MRSKASRPTEVIVSLSALIKIHVDIAASFCLLSTRKDIDNEFSEGPPRWAGGREYLPCEERLGDQDWFSLQKRWLQRDLIAAPHCLYGSDQGEGARLFTVMHSSRVRVNRHKLKQEGFRLDAGRNFFSTGMVKHRLPREAVQSPCLEVFKTHVHKVLIDLTADPAMSTRLDWSPFQSRLFCDPRMLQICQDFIQGAFVYASLWQASCVLRAVSISSM